MKFKEYIEEAEKQSFTTKDKCSKCGKEMTVSHRYGNVQPHAVVCSQCSAAEREKEQKERAEDRAKARREAEAKKK